MIVVTARLKFGSFISSSYANVSDAIFHFFASRHRHCNWNGLLE